MASTMFEPNHARKGFPCFDEPQYKATFKIIMMHNASYMANSNMLPYKEVSLWCLVPNLKKKKKKTSLHPLINLQTDQTTFWLGVQ